jgi:hypothetical protein
MTLSVPALPETNVQVEGVELKVALEENDALVAVAASLLVPTVGPLVPMLAICDERVAKSEDSDELKEVICADRPLKPAEREALKEVSCPDRLAKSVVSVVSIEFTSVDRVLRELDREVIDV